MPSVSLFSTVKAALSADSQLNSYLPGGIKDNDDFGRGGVSLAVAPKMVDGITINPFAYLSWGAEIPTGPVVLPSEARSLTVWCYEDANYDSIRPAVARVKQLLHRQFFLTNDTDLAQLLWIGGLGETNDDAMGGASVNNCRFQVTLLRN